MFYHESNKHCSQSLGEHKNLQRLNQASPHSTACGGLTCHFDSLPLCPRVLLDHFIRMADCILECRLQTWCPVWNCPEWLWMSLALHARENNSKAITLCRELACLLWKLPEAIANLSGTTLEIASSSDTLDPAPTLQPGWGQGWYDLFTEPWECYEGLLPTTGSSPLPPWPRPLLPWDTHMVLWSIDLRCGSTLPLVQTPAQLLTQVPQRCGFPATVCPLPVKQLPSHAQ